ncbi:Nucleolar protein 10 [Aphelenchoides fujianensis]|nr:Nucleolar protein 10 [Aphelenchoides fujianensis]
MQVSTSNDVKIYNLSAGKSIPQWLSERKRRNLERKDFVFAAGTYKPTLKCFDVNDLSLKFERGLDADVVKIVPLTEDYSKALFFLLSSVDLLSDLQVVLLEKDRYLEFHARFGRYFRMRIPKFGRDVAFCREASDLFIVGNGPDVYRLNIEEGKFLSPLSTQADELNCCEFNDFHQLFVCGTSNGTVEAWDHRDGQRAGVLNCDLDQYKEDALVLDGNPMVTSCKFKDALNLAVGTSTGHNHNLGLPIHGLDFVPEQDLVLSMDTRVLKMWKEQSGEPFAAIEPGAKLVEFVLLFFANDAPKMLQYFVPALGPAPKWCYYLDSLTEELEETEQPAVYDDYKFVTPQHVEQNGKAVQKKKKLASTLLEDARFKDLFANPDFQVDAESEHFQQIASRLQKHRDQHGDGRDYSEDEDEEIPTVGALDLNDANEARAKPKQRELSMDFDEDDEEEEEESDEDDEERRATIRWTFRTSASPRDDSAPIRTLPPTRTTRRKEKEDEEDEKEAPKQPPKPQRFKLVGMPVKPVELVVYEYDPKPASEIVEKHELAAALGPNGPLADAQQANERLTNFAATVDRFNRVLLLTDDLKVDRFFCPARAAINEERVQWADRAADAYERLRAEVAEFEAAFKQDPQGLDEKYVHSLRALLTAAGERLRTGDRQTRIEELDAPKAAAHADAQPPTAASLSERLARINHVLSAGDDAAAPRFTYPLEVIVEELIFQVRDAPPTTSMNTEIGAALNGLQDYLRHTKDDFNTKCCLREMLENADTLAAARSDLAKAAAEVESGVKDGESPILRQLDELVEQVGRLAAKK